MATSLALLALAACTDDGRSSPTADAARPAGSLPRPVEVRQEPEGVTLADPAFDPLPGAEADFGRLGGAVYQLEVPEKWNRKLVLWMHGFEDFGTEAGVSAPDIRAYLIAQGYAWGASSFSSTSWIPGRSSDETAALWDHFATRHGRPDRTYVIGLSMGGAAGHIAAERYANRFDGVMALCGAAGATSGLTDGANQFVAAAYVAGVTQREFDASPDKRALIRDRIRPALQDSSRRDRFERIMVDLTGGPRPFDREGFRDSEETNWRRLELSVASGVVPQRNEPYRLGPTSGITDQEFNRSVLRLHTNDELLRAFVEGNEVSGDLQVPLLTLHSTGDGQVPIEQARIERRRVDGAGRGDLLVQRVIRDLGHCGFTSTEWVATFEALVDWVETGVKPDGVDVLTEDLDAPSPSFELQPRPGTPEAEGVAGAKDRVVVRGTATVDGKPFDARWLGARVLRDGLTVACQLALVPVVDGAFELTVVADSEAYGCGTAGAAISFWTYVGDAQLNSTDVVTWPGDGATERLSVTFSTVAATGSAPPVMEFAGDVLGSDGRYARPGTRIEAYAGSTLCGVGSTRSTGSFSGYTLAAAGPTARPGCASDATLTFRVDGKPVAQTVSNAPGSHRSPFDLTVG
jgi:pimeloyl-ACP methyl ester carboxylesterase